MKKIFTIAIACTLIGCASTGKVMDTWIGHEEGELISTWGAPSNTLALEDRTVHTWNSQFDLALFGAHPQTYHCARTFTIQNGRVVTWAYQGAGC